MYENNPIYYSGPPQLDRNDAPGDEASYYGPSPSTGFPEQLEQALDILYRRKVIILCCFLTAVLAAAAYAFTRQPVYEATSYVIVDLASESRGQNRSTMSVDSDNLFAKSNRTISDELLLLQVSSPLPVRVARRLEEVEDTLRVKQSASGVPLQPDQIAARVGGAISLAPAGGKVVRVKATSQVPKEAALLANLYAEEYEALTQEASRADYSSSWEFLTAQEEKWSSELREVERQMKAYQGRQGTANLNQEHSYLVTRLANLEAQRDEARIQLKVRKNALASTEQELENITPQLAERISSNVSERINRVREEIVALKDERDDMRSRYPADQRSQQVEERLSEMDRKIEALQQEMEQLSEQYVREGTEHGGGSGDDLVYVTDLRRQASDERSAIDELQTRIGVLESRIEEARSGLQAIPQQSMQLAQMERSRIYAERMYQTVMERMLEARLAGEGEQADGYVRVLRKAGVPGIPVDQNVPRTLMLGVFFGALLGVGLAVVREKVDNRIYKPDQLREKGHNVVGVVPSMDALLDRNAHNKNGHGVSSSLVTLSDPMSPAVEAYRHLRTSIQFGAKRDIRTLMVTSPNMGEGKSLTAVNLAVVMAQSGRRTLLVDADLRRPRISSMLRLQGDHSLSEFLRDNTRDQVVQTDIHNLWAIPAGAPVTDSAELLTMMQSSNVFQRLCQQFDVVIIDTPPMLAATDAALLGAQCDATIVVARAGQTKEKELEDTVDRLSEVGAKSIGALLNDFDISNAYGYNYAYSSYYGYGQPTDYNA